MLSCHPYHRYKREDCEDCGEHLAAIDALEITDGGSDDDIPTDSDVPYEGIQFHSEELRIAQQADSDYYKQLMKEAVLMGENLPDEFWILWNHKDDLQVTNGILVLWCVYLRDGM